LVLVFYNFQKGFEHMLGYSISNFKGIKGSEFVFLKERSASMLVDKYLDYFLFNRMNIAYHYHNSGERNVFLFVQKFHHSTNFEIVSASLPTVIILLILIPSTLLLYSLDEELEPLITYKVIGHQWF
jgi:hypothetical protein